MASQVYPFPHTIRTTLYLKQHILCQLHLAPRHLLKLRTAPLGDPINPLPAAAAAAEAAGGKVIQHAVLVQPQARFLRRESDFKAVTVQDAIASHVRIQTLSHVRTRACRPSRHKGVRCGCGGDMEEVVAHTASVRLRLQACCLLLCL